MTTALSALRSSEANSRAQPRENFINYLCFYCSCLFTFVVVSFRFISIVCFHMIHDLCLVYLFFLAQPRENVNGGLRARGSESFSAIIKTHTQEGIRNQTEPNRPNRTEPKLISEPAGTGRGTEPSRAGPSHDASEKCRPNRAEPGNINFRTEPNRTDNFSKAAEPKRIEPKRFLPEMLFG